MVLNLEDLSSSESFHLSYIKKISGACPVVTMKKNPDSWNPKQAS